jgi:hypothetical protein
MTSWRHNITFNRFTRLNPSTHTTDEVTNARESSVNEFVGGETSSATSKTSTDDCCLFLITKLFFYLLVEFRVVDHSISSVNLDGDVDSSSAVTLFKLFSGSVVELEAAGDVGGVPANWLDQRKRVN